MSNSALQALEASRRDLLDLGLRNTLLNFRELKSRGVRVVDERSDQLFRILVQDEKPMSFLPAPESDEDFLEDAEDELAFEQPTEEEEDEGLASHHVDDKLQTPYADAALQRRLLNTYYASRTFIEERGVNVLYLALGMLRWFEDPRSDKLRDAPLVLVPVELYRSNVKSRFKLRYTGSDLGANHSLEVKLRLDLGIELPPFPADEDVDLLSYLDAIAEEVSVHERWSVEPHAVNLGFFSFTKLLMYEDLDPANWPENRQPHEDELLSKLLDSGFDDDPLLLEGEDTIDQALDPGEVFQVVDADSSQTVAIHNVMAGQNMVIQGPPGTGKSQTITNLVAEALAQKKTVLFVAEKMAALEVVRRRLESIGIGDACIEIHSHTTNKKEFLQELERTLKLGSPAKEERSLIANTIRETRDRLNSYAAAVNEPIGDSGLSPFMAYGRLLALDRELGDEELPGFEYSSFHRWNRQEFETLVAKVREFQELLARMGTPTVHPFWGSQAEAFIPTMDSAPIRSASEKAVRAIEQLQTISTALAASLGLERPSSPARVGPVLRAARKLIEAPQLTGVDVDNPAWRDKPDRVEKAIEVGQKIKDTRESHSELLPHAWKADVLSVRGAIAAYGDKWWRFFSSDYRRAKRELSTLWQGKLPGSTEEHLAALDAVLLVDRLRGDLSHLEGLLESLYGHMPSEEADEWRSMGQVLGFLKRVHEEISNRSLPGEILSLLEGRLDRQRLRNQVDATEAAKRELGTALEEARTAAKFPETEAGYLSPESESPFDSLRTRLESWGSKPGRMQDIAAFNVLSAELEDEALHDLVTLATTWEKAGAHLEHAFRRARLASLLEVAMHERKILSSFDGGSHEQTIERFRNSDEALLAANRISVATKHWEGLPSITGVGQVGTLLHEMQKKRRHRPIRQLMLESGRAIQAIKPVFMMSPLSIATFLPPGSVEFDLVVFDEASQVRPVDAFGALLRAGQAVVVGDSKQLPPTSFFSKMADGEESDEWEDSTSDLESILGAFLAKGAKQCMLKWHYRSRHESLIAVSNEEFYDRELKIFPSPDAAKENAGLVFHHLPHTHYERGRGRAYNRGEAKAVAQAAMKHAKSYPGRSLGVASFSQAQMQVILDELELLRRQDPSCEPYFSAHPEEPFFVKNLENVQGDERDVIYISVGYGRTEDGFLSMNFGPLNQDGGERRLNVLVTRARYRCEVFSNLRSEDIDTNRSNARGVVAFKRYLKFAEHGILDLPHHTALEADSVFEEMVADEIGKHGHEVHHQIGSKGFLIDLAIVDPEKPGRYLLGIECDGAAYHSARWARDRDRLRQQVLEGLGWTIHRIWSTDWFRSPERELRKVLEAIQRAKSTAATAPEPSQAAPVSTFSVPRTDSAPLEEPLEEADRTLPPYELSSPVVMLGDGDLHTQPPDRISGWVEEVVRVESPVHLTEVVSRVTNAAGYQRAGSRIREAIERGVKRAASRGVIRMDSEAFLWAPDMRTPPARDRSELPVANRKFELIPLEEIQVVLLEEIAAAHGAHEDEIGSAVCRRLGFARTSQAMSERVDGVLRALLSQGKVERQGQTLVVLQAEDGAT